MLRVPGGKAFELSGGVLDTARPPLFSSPPLAEFDVGDEPDIPQLRALREAELDAALREWRTDSAQHTSQDSLSAAPDSSQLRSVPARPRVGAKAAAAPQRMVRAGAARSGVPSAAARSDFRSSGSASAPASAPSDAGRPGVVAPFYNAFPQRAAPTQGGAQPRDAAEGVFPSLGSTSVRLIPADPASRRGVRHISFANSANSVSLANSARISQGSHDTPKNDTPPTADALLAFHRERFAALQKQFATHSELVPYLREQAERLVSRSLGQLDAEMTDAARQGLALALDAEEQELRHLVTEPSPSPDDIADTFASYTRKREHWLRERNTSEAECATWRREFVDSLMVDCLTAEVDRLCQTTPDLALTLMQAATGQARSDQIAAARALLADPDRLDILIAQLRRLFSLEQLQVLHLRAEAAQQEQTLRVRQRCAMVRVERDSALVRALESQDFTRLRAMEQELKELATLDPQQGVAGQRAELASLRHVAELFSPMLQAVRYAPLVEQGRTVTALAARPDMGTGHNREQAVLHIARLAHQVVRERAVRFVADPAGYVAESEAEYGAKSEAGYVAAYGVKQPSLTDEQGLSRLLAAQAALGQGSDPAGWSPRVLPNALVAHVREVYEQLPDTAMRSNMLCEFSRTCGRYAGWALAEAGLPLVPFAAVLSELPACETTRLLAATDVRLEDLGLAPARMASIRHQVADSPLVHSLNQVSAFLCAEDGSNLQRERGFVTIQRDALVATLESYTATGGNLTDLTRRCALKSDAGHVIDKVMLTGDDTKQNTETSHSESSFMRGLGTFGRGALENMLGLGDVLLNPLRWLMNKANGLAGGNPEFFQPLAETVPDGLGLPRPETDVETYARQGGEVFSSLLMAWAGNALLVERGSVALPGALDNLRHLFGQTFGGSYAGNLASGLGAAAGAAAAKGAGADPWGQFGAGIIGGLVAPGAAGSARAMGKSKSRTYEGSAGEAERRYSPTLEMQPHHTGPLSFDENKWNYLFGRATGSQHNLDRTRQLKECMEYLGLEEIPEHKQLLLDHLDEVARTYPVIKINKDNPNKITKESFFTGPSGETVKLETTFEVNDNGTLRFITMVPKKLN